MYGYLIDSPSYYFLRSFKQALNLGPCNYGFVFNIGA